MAWTLGNTTLRNPYRIRDGAIALSKSPLNGNLSGTRNEQRFALLLYAQDVVKPAEGARLVIPVAETTTLDARHSIPALGRKWRSALDKLGFITQDTYAITASGQRLIEAEKIVQQQDCFLRALAAFRDGPDRSFSPLHFVLRVIQKLEDANPGDGYITFAEMAVAVETRENPAEVDAAVKQIHLIRAQRDKGKLRQMEERLIRQAIDTNGLEIKPATLRDYADTNFRYLKATGLFVVRGRGITLDPKKALLAKLLAEQETPPLTEKQYLAQLYAGAALPTDQKDNAVIVIEDLLDQLRLRGRKQAKPALETFDTHRLEQLRLGLQDELRNLDEIDFAARQAGEVEEIVGWLEALHSGKSVTLGDGRKIEVPRSERPAYLEWAVWRAFLAMDSLINAPWESRRFQIDNDFLPIGTAPGNGPDMVFEFEKDLVVVEVTFTGSSRQEAAEGEPVRRHVAVYAEKAVGKEVTGLFIAPNIDSNTANTFRLGEWYRSNDTKVSLDIVPMPLDDFRLLVKAGRKCLSDMPRHLCDLLVRCRAKANSDAPAWKQAIRKLAKKACEAIAV